MQEDKTNTVRHQDSMWCQLVDCSAAWSYLSYLWWRYPGMRRTHWPGSRLSGRSCTRRGPGTSSSPTWCRNRNSEKTTGDILLFIKKVRRCKQTCVIRASWYPRIQNSFFSPYSNYSNYSTRCQKTELTDNCLLWQLSEVLKFYDLNFWNTSLLRL